MDGEADFFFFTTCLLVLSLCKKTSLGLCRQPKQNGSNSLSRFNGDSMKEADRSHKGQKRGRNLFSPYRGLQFFYSIHSMSSSAVVVDGLPSFISNKQF